MSNAVNPYVLILGTADWDQPIATNQHYIARELCRDGFANVAFMESIALRRPTMSVRDISRVLRRVRAVLTRSGSSIRGEWRPRPKGLSVRSPIVVPIHRGIMSAPNSFLIRRKIHDWINFNGPRVLWSFTPVTYGLEESADVTLYHCVDLLGDVQGVDSRAIERGEAALAAKGVSAVASSRVVRTHLIDSGYADVRLWENVADVETVTRAAPEQAERAPRRVIFAGNLTPTKVDYQLLNSLAESGLEVCVAGPRAEGGVADREAFATLMKSGVRYLGMLTLPELAAELVKARVGIIPYVLNDYTRGVSPLKTFEYLAAGLAVVSTPLPGLQHDGEHVWVEETESSFVDRVTSLVEAGPSMPIRERMSIANAHSWKGRGEQARQLVQQMLEEHP